MGQGVAAPEKVVWSADSCVRFQAVVGTPDATGAKVNCVVALGRSV